MMKSTKYVSITIIGVLAITMSMCSCRFYSEWSRGKRYDSAYKKVEAGNSKQIVTELFGQPEEITHCYNSWASEKLDAICSEEYWYRASLSQWIIYFDKNGKVFDKNYNVLY
jgi:hypothetical protein